MKSDAIILNLKCTSKLELLATGSIVFSHGNNRKEDSLRAYDNTALPWQGEGYILYCD